jgi:hypothetical protein
VYRVLDDALGAGRARLERELIAHGADPELAADFLHWYDCRVAVARVEARERIRRELLAADS